MSWLAQIFGKPRSSPSTEAGRTEQAERRRKTKSGLSSEFVDPLHTRRRSDRAIQRDLLNTIVREAMVGLGVLSSHFKFKVLSVDQEGSQFLVMVDLSEQVNPGMNKLALMEAVIIQRALNQRKLKITAVYWRVVTEDALRPAPKPGTGRAAPAATATTDPRKRVVHTRTYPDTELQDGQDDKPLGGTQYGGLL